MSLLTYTSYKKIIECIQHGVIITDLNGHITYSNSASQKIFGYNRKQLRGKNIRSLYGDEDVSAFKYVVLSCLRGESVRGKWHGLKSDGRKVWLDVRANILFNNSHKSGCVISLVEIEKHIKTENKLKRNEALAHTIFNASSDAIITFDESGTILKSNFRAEDLFGYIKEEIEGESFLLLLSFPFSDQIEEQLGKSVHPDVSTIAGESREYQGKSSDGKVFPIEFTVNEVEWEGTRFFTGIIRDLSARRNLERRILESGQEERRKIGIDLHDGLGQMLTGTRMLAENLAKKLKIRGAKCSDEVDEIAKMIQEADEFARKLARGLVQVDIEKKGLSVALQELCKRTEKLTGIACVFYDCENAEVYDHNLALHLYRIAQEAINNAIKHGKPDIIQVRLSNNKHHTALSVEDDGIGFSVENESADGSGIEIMKHRARVMGGVFEISRTDDGLTKIRCIVPNNMQHFN